MLGEVIRIIRIANGLSSLEMAELTGISKTHLSEIESGKKNISLANLKKVGLSCNLQPSEIMKLEEYHESLKRDMS